MHIIKNDYKMSDDSIIEELERYRRNNFELAVALNELKSELRHEQNQLLNKHRELQDVYGENATLKQIVSQKDAQIAAWRSLIMDLVSTNTRKYTELMQHMGLVPKANGTTKPTEPSNSMVQSEKTISTTATPVNNSEEVSKVQRRPKPYENEEELAARLTDLTEESIHTQFSDSMSLELSPANDASHVTARRRTSALITTAPQTPPTPSSPLRVIQERLIGNGETKKKKSRKAKTPKLEKIVDENTQNKETSGRPARKTAPKNLSEPKLGTKLRRD